MPVSPSPSLGSQYSTPRSRLTASATVIGWLSNPSEVSATAATRPSGRARA